MPKLFTDEQLEQARSTSVEDYLCRYEPDNITINKNEIRLKDHDSCVISRGLFHWHSRGVGGRCALDFLIKVRDYDFKDAVEFLLPGSAKELPEKSENTGKSPENPEGEKKTAKPFELPVKSGSTNSTEKYLANRGIDHEIVKECIANGSIYQTMFYSEKAKRSFPNAVFIGFDTKENKAKYASIRSTFGSYKQDISGSDKSFGFILPAGRNSDVVSVFESPIDVLSGASLAKIKQGSSYKNINRLSLGGVSDLALKRFLENNANIHTINLCLDNDETGQKACKRISETLEALGKERGKLYKVNILPPKQGKDYNEYLQNVHASKTVSQEKIV